MKNWKNWLLPGLTCLLAAGLALLPRQISSWQDGELIGTVHSEELASDSNFPIRLLELPKRLELLARWEGDAELITVIDQTLGMDSRESADAAEAARKELAALAEAGVLPGKDLSALWDVENLEFRMISRVYLRDQRDLSGAGFLVLECSDDPMGISYQMTLDQETGHALKLTADIPDVQKYSRDPEKVGSTFLDRLGLERETLEKGYNASVFRMDGGAVLYYVVVSKSWLQIVPSVDWEEVDAVRGTGSSAVGLSVDG